MSFWYRRFPEILLTDNRTASPSTADHAAYSPASSDDERAAGWSTNSSSRKSIHRLILPQPPHISRPPRTRGKNLPSNPTPYILTVRHPGGLIRGAMDENGKQKSAGLMVRIKLDLETEVHLTTRIRGDIVIGLYNLYRLVLRIEKLAMNDC